MVGSSGGAAHSQKGLLLAWDLECMWQPFLLRILLFPEQAEGSVRSAAWPQSSQSACSQALPPQASSVPSPLGGPHPPLLPRLLAHSHIPVRGLFLYVSEAKVWKMNLGLQRTDAFPPSACGMRRSLEWDSVSGSGWSRWSPVSSPEGICCQSPGQVHSGVVGAVGRRSPCSGRRSLASAVSPRSVCLLCNVTTRG